MIFNGGKTMKNKKFLTAVLVISILFGTILTGCEEPKELQYYYYELFTISKTDYDSVSVPSTVTFNSIKTYRDQLRSHSELIESGTDLTQDALYTFITDRGMSPTDANNLISSLNSVGNRVITFYHAQDTDSYVILYIEK
jgi:hypothetical protein